MTTSLPHGFLLEEFDKFIELMVHYNSLYDDDEYIVMNLAQCVVVHLCLISSVFRKIAFRNGAQAPVQAQAQAPVPTYTYQKLPVPKILEVQPMSAKCAIIFIFTGVQHLPPTVQTLIEMITFYNYYDMVDTAPLKQCCKQLCDIMTPSDVTRVLVLCQTCSHQKFTHAIYDKCMDNARSTVAFADQILKDSYLFVWRLHGETLLKLLRCTTFDGPLDIVQILHRWENGEHKMDEFKNDFETLIPWVKIIEQHVNPTKSKREWRRQNQLTKWLLSRFEDSLSRILTNIVKPEKPLFSWWEESDSDSVVRPWCMTVDELEAAIVEIQAECLAGDYSNRGLLLPYQVEVDGRKHGAGAGGNVDSESESGSDSESDLKSESAKRKTHNLFGSDSESESESESESCPRVKVKKAKLTHKFVGSN